MRKNEPYNAKTIQNKIFRTSLSVEDGPRVLRFYIFEEVFFIDRPGVAETHLFFLSD